MAEKYLGLCIWGFDDLADAGGGGEGGHESDLDSASDGVGDKGAAEGFEGLDLSVSSGRCFVSKAFGFLDEFADLDLLLSWRHGCNVGSNLVGADMGHAYAGQDRLKVGLEARTC